MPDFTNGAATGFVLEFPNHLLVHGAVENMLSRVISRVKLLQVWLDVSVEIIGEDLIAKAVGICILGEHVLVMELVHENLTEV